MGGYYPESNSAAGIAVRNLLVVRNADAVIAIGGEWGTLSEIALARKIGRPVILLNSWSLTTPQGNPVDLATANNPQEAVALALSDGW